MTMDTEFPAYQFHPLALAFPLMGDVELEELTADIKKHGQREPIMLADDLILDGRNRYLACKKLGIEPVVERWSSFGENSLTAFVLSANLHRRHLTTSQKAAIAVECLPFFEAEAKESRAADEKRMAEVEKLSRVAKLPPAKKAKARDGAAAALKISPRTVQDAKKVKRVSPGLHEQVKAGTITLQDAKRRVNAVTPKRTPAPDERTLQQCEKVLEKTPTLTRNVAGLLVQVDHLFTITREPASPARYAEVQVVAATLRALLAEIFKGQAAGSGASR